LVRAFLYGLLFLVLNQILSISYINFKLQFLSKGKCTKAEVREARSDVFFTNQIVNVVFIGTPEHWVLVDARMPKCGDEIRRVAEDIFGGKK
jgi:hypothetical protein